MRDCFESQLCPQRPPRSLSLRNDHVRTGSARKPGLHALKSVQPGGSPSLAISPRSIIHHFSRLRLVNDLPRLIHSTKVSMLLLSSGRIPRRLRNSKSGLRVSPNMRTLDLLSHLTPRRMAVILARRGNWASGQWTPPYGLTARKVEPYGRRLLLSGKRLTATLPKRGSQRQRP